MATIRAKLAPSWFTPDSQKAEPHPIKYRVRPLTASEHAEVLEHTKGNRISFPGLALAARYGVLDWDGAQDEKGEPVPFTRDWQDQVEIGDVLEIGGYVRSLTVLGADAEKNS